MRSKDVRTFRVGVPLEVEALEGRDLLSAAPVARDVIPDAATHAIGLTSHDTESLKLPPGQLVKQLRQDFLAGNDRWRSLTDPDEALARANEQVVVRRIGLEWTTSLFVQVDTETSSLRPRLVIVERVNVRVDVPSNRDAVFGNGQLDLADGDVVVVRHAREAGAVEDDKSPDRAPSMPNAHGMADEAALVAETHNAPENETPIAGTANSGVRNTQAIETSAAANGNLQQERSGQFLVLFRGLVSGAQRPAAFMSALGTRGEWVDAAASAWANAGAHDWLVHLATTARGLAFRLPLQEDGEEQRPSVPESASAAALDALLPESAGLLTDVTPFALALQRAWSALTECDGDVSERWSALLPWVGASAWLAGIVVTCVAAGRRRAIAEPLQPDLATLPEELS